jgi:hypothetical protein
MSVIVEEGTLMATGLWVRRAFLYNIAWWYEGGEEVVLSEFLFTVYFAPSFIF